MPRISYDEFIELAIEKIKNGEILPSVDKWVPSFLGKPMEIRISFTVYLPIEEEKELKAVGND